MQEKTAGFLASAIANFLVMIVVNSEPLWGPWTRGVVLGTWVSILWAVNLSLVVQTLGNLLLAFYRPPRLYFLVQAIHAAAALVSAIVFYVVFPLDFSRVVGSWLNALARIVVLVGIAGTAIAFLVNIAQAARAGEATSAEGG